MNNPHWQIIDAKNDALLATFGEDEHQTAVRVFLLILNKIEGSVRIAFVGIPLLSLDIK